MPRRRVRRTHERGSLLPDHLSATTESGTTIKYLYDAYGNVDCVVLGSWGSSTCPAVGTGGTADSNLVSDNVYDYRDRLVAVRSYSGGTLGDRSEYRYDPLGRQIKKISNKSSTTTTTDLVYQGLGSQVVRETEAGGSTKTRSYAFDALGQRTTLSETVSSTTTRYSYLYDALGSTEQLIDQSNTLKAAYGYTAYGDTNGSLTKTAGGFNANTNLYRYSARRFDAAAKSYDMEARTYFPTTGRWFRQDSYANALDNLGLSQNPWNANRYAFTGASPIASSNGTDTGASTAYSYPRTKTALTSSTQPTPMEQSDRRTAPVRAGAAPPVRVGAIRLAERWQATG